LSFFLERRIGSWNVKEDKNKTKQMKRIDAQSQLPVLARTIVKICCTLLKHIPHIFRSGF